MEIINVIFVKRESLNDSFEDFFDGREIKILIYDDDKIHSRTLWRYQIIFEIKFTI